MPSVPAYDAYLRALHHQATITPEAQDRAKQCYDSAIALDPVFALAHLGARVEPGSSRRCLAGARHTTRRRAFGLRFGARCNIDGSLPEAHGLLGYMAACRTTWIGTRPSVTSMRRWRDRRAIPLTRPMYGALQFLRGNSERAIELAERRGH